MRGWRGRRDLSENAGHAESPPHPALRATFSPVRTGEKEKGRFVNAVGVFAGEEDREAVEGESGRGTACRIERPALFGHLELRACLRFWMNRLAANRTFMSGGTAHRATHF